MSTPCCKEVGVYDLMTDDSKGDPSARGKSSDPSTNGHRPPFRLQAFSYTPLHHPQNRIDMSPYHEQQGCLVCITVANRASLFVHDTSQLHSTQQNVERPQAAGTDAPLNRIQCQSRSSVRTLGVLNGMTWHPSAEQPIAMVPQSGTVQRQHIDSYTGKPGIASCVCTRHMLFVHGAHRPR